jgi:hypothetical protein
MRMEPRELRVRTLLVTLVAVLGALAVWTPAASAAPPDDAFACRATALDVSTGPLPLDPILGPIAGLLSAGSDDEACATDGASPVGGVLDTTVRPALRLLGIDAAALTTETTTDASQPTRLQRPKAFARVAGLDVSVVNLASILRVDAVESTVQATCVAGTPRYTGSSQIGDVRAFGRPVTLDLDQPVTRLTGALGALGPVLELRPDVVQDGGRTRIGLRVTVIAAAGIRLLELDVARTTVTHAGEPCAPAASPVVDAPVVAPGSRTITAAVVPPTGRTIAACRFVVTPDGGGAPVSVDGTYDATARRCVAGLPLATVPAGDHTATASATTAGPDPGTTTSPSAAFTLVAPTVGTPGLNGSTVVAPATPGSGADPLTAASCAVELQRVGGATVPLGVATFEDGACRAPASQPLPAGEYAATVTVTDSTGQLATRTEAVSTLGPTVGIPALTGRVVSATVAGSPGRTIASCSFVLSRAGEDPDTVAGTVADGRCTATLGRATFPAGEYTVVAGAVDDAQVTGRNTGVVTLRGPSVGEPELDGRTLVVPVTPGTGGTFGADACTVTVSAVNGVPRAIQATYADGACTATIPSDVQPGALMVDTTVVEDSGDRGTGAGQVTLRGPTVGTPVLTGRTVAADVTPEDGTTIDACAFTVGPQGGGTARTVAGTYEAERCVATLPLDDFPDGAYAIVARATDSAGAETTRSGSGSIADPAPLTVGAPESDGRELSASVEVPADATVDRCEIAVTPKGGSASRRFAGTFADGRCTTLLPREDYPAGTTLDVVVTAEDGLGRTAQGTGEVTISIPAVDVGDATLEGRTLSVPVSSPLGVTAERCEVTFTPRGGGAATTVVGTLTDGRCRAALERSDVPPGAYDVRTRVTDSEGRTVTETSTVTVTGPIAGTPAAVGPTVTVPVTPGAGATVVSCVLSITPAGGGGAQTVDGTSDASSGTCTATLPAVTFPSGDYDVTTTVRDSLGDTATGSGRVSVGQFTPAPGGTLITPADPPAAGPPASPGSPSGPGTPPAPGAPATPAPPDDGVLGASAVAQALLACEGGRLALIEVRLVGSRVRVSGVAQPALARRTVVIRLSVSRKRTRTVGRANVRADGRFAVTVTAPPKADRRTAARAQYVAQAAGSRSGSLRLTRRTTVASVSAKGGRIRMTGRVSAPYPKAGTPVTVGRRTGCKSYRTVARTRTGKNGRFTVSFAAAKGTAGLYRVQTKAPSRVGAAARNATFSLPRIIAGR